MRFRTFDFVLGLVISVVCGIGLVGFSISHFSPIIKAHLEIAAKAEEYATNGRALHYSIVGTNAYFIKLSNDKLDVGALETINKILELTTLERGQEIQDADVLQVMRLYNDLRAAPMPNGADWGKEFEYRYRVAEMGAYLIRVATNQFDQAARDAIFEALKSANEDIIRVPLTKPKNPEVSALIETAIFKLQNAIDLTYARVAQR